MSTNDVQPPLPAAGDSDAARMVRADLVAAIAFIVLGALVLYGSWTMPRLEVRRIHPMTVPGLVPGLALLLCGGLLALRSLRTRAEGGWDALRRSLVSEGARRVFVLLVLIAVYTLGLVDRIPFWAATALFVFGFVLTFELWMTSRERRPIASLGWALGLAVVTSVTVTLVFERLFLVRLP